MQSEIENAANSVRPYISGAQESFEYPIDLVDIKALAVVFVRDHLADRVMAALREYPKCGSGRVVTSEIAALDNLPDCLPASLEVDSLQRVVESEVNLVVEPLLAELIPDRMTISETDLAAMFARLGQEDAESRLQALRQSIKDGVVLTDRDLLEGPVASALADANISDSIANVSRIGRDGITIDERDTRAMLADSAPVPLETARSAARSLNWLPWLLALIALMAAAGGGWLLGRNWRSRMLWGVGALTGSSMLALVLSWLATTLLLRSGLFARLPAAVAGMLPGNAPETQAITAAKVQEIAAWAVQSFGDGLVANSLLLTLVGLFVLLVTYFWYIIVAWCEDHAPGLTRRIRQVSRRGFPGRVV
jgi:hypothetical protein